MDSNKYLPRFRPEFYLDFLQSYDYDFEIKNDKIDGDITSSLILYPSNVLFVGSCLKECLDQAISATKFEG